jgi:hypothetical protein
LPPREIAARPPAAGRPIRGSIPTASAPAGRGRPAAGGAIA